MIRELGGRRVYVETSSRRLYAPTREFYTGLGYRRQALIPEFYGPGDVKIIYAKELSE